MVSPMKDTLNLTHISFADLEMHMDISTLSSPPKYTVKRKKVFLNVSQSGIPGNFYNPKLVQGVCYEGILLQILKRKFTPHTHSELKRRQISLWYPVDGLSPNRFCKGIAFPVPQIFSLVSV